METEITQEQKEQLSTWAGQRDNLLSEISVLQDLKSKLQEENKAVADSYTDIVTQTNVVIGRIEELKKKESELPSLISKEVASLESQKTTLESEVSSLKETISILVPQKESLQKDISFAVSLFDSVKNETLTLEKIVEHVSKVSENNKFVIEELVETLKKSTAEVVAVNQKNVSETNLVLEKLPAMLVELQKVKLIRHKI
jgi:chromosome segregation ATPase